MTADIAIRAEGLGKKYLIGHQAQRERYTALRDVIARTARSLGRSALDFARGNPLIQGDEVEEFWALKNVDFEIKRGDVVGVIGRNGAGKSTLLKILSRITEPSSGRVTIRGRVASLLEVGTGFHPELTGRENIYLNGAILGMTRAEIRRKFDEIVDFAGVERFLDTPVKRYSSGMYVRLAFAVAAHLEPEILVIDEVLAVGDAEFQRKCLGKMQDVAGHGRTVLFVSHNIGSVQALCRSAIMLKSGEVVASGPTSTVLPRYLITASGRPSPEESVVAGRISVGAITIEPASPVTNGELTIELLFSSRHGVVLQETALLFHNGAGQRIGIVDLRRDRVVPMSLTNSPVRVTVKIELLPLIEGEYALGLYLVGEGFSGIVHDVARFAVLGSETSEGWTPYASEYRGIVEFRAIATTDVT